MEVAIAYCANPGDALNRVAASAQTASMSRQRYAATMIC